MRMIYKLKYNNNNINIEVIGSRRHDEMKSRNKTEP